MLIEWNAGSFSLGIAEMDSTHAEFIDLLNQLHQASNTEFPALFQQLEKHTLAHFESEQARMIDTAFPAVREHSGEHQRILGDLSRISKQIDRGRLAFGRRYIREVMPDWFRLHAATMDSALAAHWKSCQPDTA